MKLSKEPMTFADAAMYHPFIPHTKPAIVIQLEYPMTGGKAVKQVIRKRIIHPPGNARHFSAMGAMASNIRGEKIRKVMPRALTTTAAVTKRTFCLVVADSQVETICACALARLCTSFSLKVGLCPKPYDEDTLLLWAGREERRAIAGRSGSFWGAMGDCGDGEREDCDNGRLAEFQFDMVGVFVRPNLPGCGR